MFRLAANCLILMMLSATIAASAVAETPGGNSKVITWQSATANDEIFVGILGEVARPGVYQLDPQSLTLHSVIRRAGGLTDEASMTIRIVRGERVVQSGFFSPNVDGPLQTGDLLIVESKRTQAAISRTYESDPQIRAALASAPPRETPQEGLVQLAFLNVLDRPVIVKVRHEDANLLHIVQKLAQPIELAQSVRVISPERLLSQATPQPVQAPMAEGSVLVFPPRSIIRSKLPPLPPAFESRIASGAFPSLIGGAAGQSAELRNVGQLPPLVARQSDMQLPQLSPTQTTISQTPLAHAPQRPSETPQMPRFEEQTTLPSPSASSIPVPPSLGGSGQGSQQSSMPMQQPESTGMPRIANVPFSGSPRVKSLSNTNPLRTESVNAAEGHLIREGAGREINDIPQPYESLSGKQQSPHAIDMPQIQDHEAKEGTPSPKDSDSQTLVLIAAGVLGSFGLVAILLGAANFTRRVISGRPLSVNLGQTGTDLPRQTVFEESNSADVAAPIVAPEIEKVDKTIAAADVGAVTAIERSVNESHELPQPVATRSLSSRLDQLIRNELRVHEEAIEFPRQIVLQGKIAPKPVFRVDPAMSKPVGQGPHFPIPATEDFSASNAAKVVELQSVTEALDGSHPTGPSRPHFMRRAGERTVAAAATATAQLQPLAASEPKSSPTPLSDALRQLQGGQP